MGDRQDGTRAGRNSQDEFVIANEFATVIVRKVHTRNGVRLEIASPKLGHSIRLDPLELESLTWQTTETFSRFLETPFGPGS
ncbi:hypothetical protein HRbin24_01432 [bacterium HR24]|jgi:hypothetical protein|nr:hypothetical protein HRbin24_01432 [bacterium HR24]